MIDKLHEAPFSNIVFTLTAVEVRAWMSNNYIALFHAITYPCYNQMKEVLVQGAFIHII